MKSIKFAWIALLLLIGAGNSSSAQTYVKLNGLYALAGVINPAVEFRISPHSTFQTEFVFSPWKSVTIKGDSGPMFFGIFMNEYRRYFKAHNQGWYVGANAGMMAFDMARPTWRRGGLGLKNIQSKGYGFMFGIVGGYEWIFNDKWVLDVYAGFAWMHSDYNGYSLVDGLVEGGHVYNKGEVIMTPGQGYNEKNDPWNSSGEWLPNKVGVSFGMKIFDPAKRKNK